MPEQNLPSGPMRIDRGPTAEAYDPELAARLYNTLSRAGFETELDSRLQELEEVHGDAVYAELLRLLCRLHFEPDEARRHWRLIVEHRGLLEERLGTHVDPRVALTSYFLQVNRRLENPMVIEMHDFEKARLLAYRDELTGLRNYRYFTESLPQEILRSEQDGSPLSLILIDVDNFKQYNDLHGHAAGNEALAKFGHLITDSLRRVDIAVRYGGEEFVILAPSTTKTGALLLAERVRKAIEREPFTEQEAGSPDALTVSVGIATYPGDANSAAELLRLADRALYDAKTSGRNQVQLYRSNRRSFPRVNAALEGSFNLAAAEQHPFTTLNVSEGGVRFVTAEQVTTGSLLDIHLLLPDSDRALSLAGRALQVKANEANRFDVAVRIISIGQRDRWLLSQYVQTLQPQSED